MPTKEENIVGKKFAEAVSKEINSAIEEIFKKHGLKVTKTQTTYGDSYAFKVQATIPQMGANGVDLSSKEAIEYERFGYSWFKVEADRSYAYIKLEAPLGTEFVVNAKTYIFAGVNHRKQKFPIYAINKADGKHYGLPDSVVPMINAAAKAA